MSAYCSCCSQEVVLPGDILINEVLFNPVKDGFDYVEGYNASSKTINLEGIRIANRNASGDIAGLKAVVKSPAYLAPGGYFVVTANESWLKQHYRVGPAAVICVVSSLPSFPDDEGTVIFLNGGDVVIDELHYRETWHFGLIADASGVALERVQYAARTQDPHNWASASSSSGYGTPGAINSQFRADGAPEGGFHIFPTVFSPDNDGMDDFALITYSTLEYGFACNLMIYDMSGRRVRYLLKNQILGTTGAFKWDGLDDKARALPQGVYLLHIHIFNLKGSVKKFRYAVVIARKHG